MTIIEDLISSSKLLVMTQTLVVSLSILNGSDGFDEPRVFFVEDSRTMRSGGSWVDFLQKMILIQYPDLHERCNSDNEFNDELYVELVHNFYRDYDPQHICSGLTTQLRASKIRLYEDRIRCRRR